MATFSVVTQYDREGSEISINLDHVCTMQRRGDFTVIEFYEGTLNVRETPQQVLDFRQTVGAHDA